MGKKKKEKKKKLAKKLIKKFEKIFNCVAIYQLTIVKWDYDSRPEEWKKGNPNPYEGLTFMYIGEINKMQGHSFTLEMKSGKPYVLHTEELLPLTEEEL
jgi:hypothetical protein